MKKNRIFYLTPSSISNVHALLAQVNPEPALPAQYYSAPAREPWEILMLAVLEQAFLDYHKTYERARALRWFTQEEPDYIFSFSYICSHFGLQKNRLREQLKTTPTQPRQRLRSNKRIHQIKLKGM